YVPGSVAFSPSPCVAAPEVFVGAVMEVEDLQVAELAACRGEQLFNARDVVVHADADIQQHQYLHRIVAFGHHADVQHAGVARGAGDRIVQVKLSFGAFSREAAQAPTCHLEIARADFLLIVVVAELTAFPYLDRRAVAGRRTADAYALGMVAAVAEG